MRLNNEGLKDRKSWENAGYSLPEYDRETVTKATRENPFWIHFGAGNIFRAFQANVVQDLLNQGVLDRGLVVAEGYDYEIIQKMNHPHDDYSILVTLKANGTVEKTIVGSVVESLALDSDNVEQFQRLKEIFSSDSLQMASFTITEKGYNLYGADGKFTPLVATDLAAGPEAPISYIGKVASLLYARFLAGEKPIAMVSMDNCSHNGDKLAAAIGAFAEGWSRNGLADKDFESYIKTSGKVSFPWTMIDKITPRPDASIEALLKKDGVEELDPVITGKHTYVAPFVNAEECQYLVIEDNFPNGRPALEKGGLIFTTRETVDKVEKMKVCTCLNPLHTAMSIYGCMLGYTLISAEMADEDLRSFIQKIGYIEAMPVVVDPGVLNPYEFIGAVINRRLPNPFMPDAPQRIATDTSQKLAIRFGETIKAYEARGLDKSNLVLIPLVLAGYARYLKGIDDNGQPFEISTDPLLAELQAIVAPLKVEAGEQDFSCLKALYSRTDVFGVDLYAVGLGEKIESMAKELFAGPGAVRATLHKYVKAR